MHGICTGYELVMDRWGWHYGKMGIITPYLFSFFFIIV
jgi:hypothetical protein